MYQIFIFVFIFTQIMVEFKYSYSKEKKHNFSEVSQKKILIFAYVIVLAVKSRH